MTETTQQRDGLKWLNDMGVAEVHYFHCGGRYAGNRRGSLFPLWRQVRRKADRWP